MNDTSDRNRETGSSCQIGSVSNNLTGAVCTITVQKVQVQALESSNTDCDELTNRLIVSEDCWLADWLRQVESCQTGSQTQEKHKEYGPFSK